MEGSRPLVSELMEALRSLEPYNYGEDVTMLEHSLKTADAAIEDSAPTEVIVAALLHDIGNAEIAVEATESAKHGWMKDPNGCTLGIHHHDQVGEKYLTQM